MSTAFCPPTHGALHSFEQLNYIDAKQEALIDNSSFLLLG